MPASGTTPHATRLRWRDWAIVAGLVLVVAAVYAPVVGYDFVDYDDGLYVAGNPQVRGGLTADGVGWAFTHVHGAYWIPLTWLSYQFDSTLLGDNPGSYHLTNVLLHAANTGLLFLVLRRMTGAVWRSLAVALLFGLHPLRVESVAWVTERKDVLSQLFALLALLAYARPGGGAPGCGRLAAVAVCLALGMLAKPMLVTFPFALLLIDAWPLNRLRSASDFGPLVREKYVLFLIAAVFTALTFAIHSGAGATADLQVVPPLDRAANALVGYVVYLRMTVWPTGLAVLYPLTASPPVRQALCAAALLAGLTAAAWTLRRPAPYLLVGWLWFLGTLVPVIGLSQAGEQAYADRFTYLPHLGLLVAVVWGVADLLARLRAPAWAGGIACIAAATACALLTSRQLPHWRDTRAMWEQVTRVSPESTTGWRGLSRCHFAADEIDEGLACLDRASAVAPWDLYLADLRRSTYFRYGRPLD